MPRCPVCNSTDVERIGELDYVCVECENNFVFDGEEAEESDMMVEGDSLDMQAFEDRISCIGDD
jgi:hypothetical protein